MVAAGKGSYCLMMEFQFGKMKSSAGGWWWWLYNIVSVISATELYV